MSSTVTLRTVVFFGSARDVQPPWGGDKRLGDRVLAHVKSVLNERKATLPDAPSSSPPKSTEQSSVEVRHEVTVFDPLEVFSSKTGALATSGAELKTPHFHLGGSAPAEMNEMRDTIKQADCILVVSPEYNHSVPPALSSLLDHFGGSNYGYKPSGIVTYSMGPWGGMRCAMALRPLLAELGCVSVSRVCGFPVAGDMFETDGTPKDPGHRMLKQLPNMLSQLEWTAVAMKRMREISDPSGI